MSTVLDVPETVSSAWESEVCRGVNAEGVAAAAAPGDLAAAAVEPADGADRDRRAKLADAAVLLIPVSAGAWRWRVFAARHSDLDAELTTVFVAAVGLSAGTC